MHLLSRRTRMRVRTTFRDARRARRRGTRAAITASVITGVIASWIAVSAPADASTSAVSIRAIPGATVAHGAKATVKPVYTRGKRVAVRSATVSVRQGSTWVTRNARSAKLRTGTYRVTTKVSYKVRGQAGSAGRVRTASRTQTLQVKAPAGSVPTRTPPAPAPTASAPTSLATTSSACDSSSLRKADGTAWTCSFSDEFTGTTLNSDKWMAQLTSTTGYRLGGDCFVDDPDNIAVGGGVLSLTVRKQAREFTCASPYGDYTAQHTSGMVSSWHAFDQAYGRFEIRAAFPKTSQAGLHSALWLYPKHESYGSWPLSGEIDIAEMFSNWSDRVIPFVHSAAKVDESNPVTNNYCMIDDVSTFHTYTVEWTKTAVSIAYDGTTCLTYRLDRLSSTLGTAPFDQPFIIALTQGLGLGSNEVTDRTPSVGTTKVDYVRVWK